MTDTFSMKNWDEQLVSGVDGGPRIAHAHATMAYSGLLEGRSVLDYLLYYAGEGHDSGGTAARGFERFEGQVAGRRGSFIVKHETAFDPKGIRSEFAVVPGSGTGDLAAITGTGTTSGVIGEPTMAYTFDFTLA